MTELRICCNCEEYYHYHDDGIYENDPDYCDDCTRSFGKNERLIEDKRMELEDFIENMDDLEVIG